MDAIFTGYGRCTHLNDSLSTWKSTKLLFFKLRLELLLFIEKLTLATKWDPLLLLKAKGGKYTLREAHLGYNYSAN